MFKDYDLQGPKAGHFRIARQLGKIFGAYDCVNDFSTSHPTEIQDVPNAGSSPRPIKTIKTLELYQLVVLKVLKPILQVPRAVTWLTVYRAPQV